MGNLSLDKSALINKKLQAMEDIPIINFLDQLQDIENDISKAYPSD